MTFKTSMPALLSLLALTACSGGGSGETSTPAAAAPITTTTTSATSSPATTTTSTTTALATPRVDAGYARVAIPGTSLRLNATVVGGEDTRLHWEQTRGTTATLDDATVADPTLVVPAVATSELLEFRLTADDGINDPVSDTVLVQAWVRQPVADQTAYGDFSHHTGWGCTMDPPTSPTVTITSTGDQHAYVGNGIPSHSTGTFPNTGNPNTITETDARYSIPARPVKTDTVSEMLEFGITLDGIKLERDTAESYRNAGVWRYEAITSGLANTSTSGAQFSWLGTDCNNAHVQPTGSYHYHGLPESLIHEPGDRNTTAATMILGGYAADGFPFYLRNGHSEPGRADSDLVPMQGSWELRAGTRGSTPFGSYDGTFREDWEYVAGSGDLDQCNGRFGVTPEHPDGIYHYYLTDDYPFIPRCVMGTPDPSFRAGRRAG